MDVYCNIIDVEKKVPYESQIALWIYQKMKGINEQFEDSIISENLIYEFNMFIKNEENKNIFINRLQLESNTIKSLMDIFLTQPWKIIKPVIWNNNLGNDYFITNLILSHRFEIYIECLFRSRNVEIGLYYGRDGQYNGETEVGIEIKRDMKLRETGNIYIEYAERHYINNPWVNSGILKDDNTRYYLIGDINEFYILRREDLVDIYDRLNRGQNYKGCRKAKAGMGTSLGFIMNRNIAANIGMSLNNIIEEL